jgi:D-alanyl-D-alanine carboxypeptidase
MRTWRKSRHYYIGTFIDIMLLSSSYQLWAISVTNKPLDFTRFVISIDMTEGLNASRSQIRVRLAPEAKVMLQNVKRGSEWQLLWGYSATVFRKASGFWTGTVWNIGGNSSVEITLVNLGQWSLTRGTSTRAIGQSLEDMAKNKGVALAGAKAPKGKIVPRVQAQLGVPEILRQNPGSFIKWGFDTEATAEVVAFSELGTKAQLHYISTAGGYVGEFKITYNAQLPKDQSFMEVTGKGLVQEAGPGLPTPQSKISRAIAAGAPDPKNDSQESFGLWSYYVQDLQGKTIRAYNALKPPEDGTSMLKLFVGLAIRARVLKGEFSISQQWQGKTIAQHLTLALDATSSNSSANALIARLGGIGALNEDIKALGFTLTSFRTVFGVSSPRSEQIPLVPLPPKYRSEALAAGYLEPYGESPRKDLHPLVREAVAKMRRDSGFALKEISGFRSYKTQESIWLGKPVATRADFSAPPGYSQHHTGLAVDLVALGRFTPTQRTQLTWLRNNCQKYGFILPYMNTSGDLGPGNEPWHLIWVGNGAAMSVFHTFISRAKATGYNPLSEAQEALFNNPGSLDSDKESCCYDLAKAFESVIKGTDPVSVVMKNALKGAYIGLEGEDRVKSGYTSKNMGVTLSVGDKYILSAYITGSKVSDLQRGVKALSRSIIMSR